ncbi:MAG: pirin family protein [Pseudomonadota bacterium]|nr:pirin family protein [Pseudomonadota bacterium]
MRIPTRDAILGTDMQIRRALPNRQQRMIGAWCFLDQAGPANVQADEGMYVAPHPHIGLQTFTWMIEGEILHQDSLGYRQVIRPNQVNLMTAGYGISHAETSPTPRPPCVHAAQLWIALPDAQFDIAPAFEHYPELPTIQQAGFKVTVLTGELFNATSPVAVHSPLLAADLHCEQASQINIPLRRDFEYGILVLDGAITVADQPLEIGTLLYWPTGGEMIQIQTHAAARFLLIGGTPFESERLIWWNFVGRNQADIEQAIQDWQHSDRFGQVEGFSDRLEPPELVGRIKASGG